MHTYKWLIIDIYQICVHFEQNGHLFQKTVICRVMKHGRRVVVDLVRVGSEQQQRAQSLRAAPMQGIMQRTVPLWVLLCQIRAVLDKCFDHLPHVVAGSLVQQTLAIVIRLEDISA